MNTIVNFLKHNALSGAAAFLMLAFSGCATKKEFGEPLSFIQMTDIQFGFFEIDQKFNKEH